MAKFVYSAKDLMIKAAASDGKSQVSCLNQYAQIKCF